MRPEFGDGAESRVMERSQKARRPVWRIAGWSLAAAAFLAACFHLLVPPVYRFPPSVPFSGDRWHNPYAGTSSAVWLRANFHVHARAGVPFGGGRQPVSQVWEHYDRLGYDVIGISNYMSLRPPRPGERLYVAAYEHGYGIGQQHQTVLGARAVNWLDFPLYQGLRQKQYVLDCLGADGALVVINHPNKNRAYAVEDMKRLTGYLGVEVRTKYARGEACWDAALSSGRTVWGFCGDDGHDLERPSHSAIGWNMIAAAERSAAAVRAALRAGRFYGVWTRKKKPPNVLEGCEVEAGRLRVSLLAPADAIRFIGQGGQLREEHRDARTADYCLRPEDTYVRVEAATGLTTLYLNPVFRSDGPPLQPRAEARVGWTWGIRVAVLLAAAILVFLLRAKGLLPVPRRRSRDATRS